VNPAILFDPDGFLLTGAKLMGRQSAGDGFLRAAVKARGTEPLYCCAPRPEAAEAFSRRVTELDPQAQVRWIVAGRLEQLAERRVLYRPDPGIGIAAYARLRVGSGRYSLCGVTHTLASEAAMQMIAGLVTAPVMPWDALVCTSTVAKAVVEDGMAAQADYLRWRLGAAAAPPGPQLPVIPLGVHPEDFAFTPADRAAARQALGIAEDEVVGLFAGRLSFHAKAQPYQTYRAFQAAAERTGRRLVLLHAGQAASAEMGEVFPKSAAAFAPDVRSVFLDGAHFDLYRRAWQAADLFVSLSDSIQETFGLTPVEAMAAGLPVLVSDWNGYRDTVRDGVDGFRIPTWQPAAGFGESLVRAYETVVHSYDVYLWRASTLVSVEAGPLVERLAALVEDAGLRRRMGEAGRARVRELFDWTVIYRRYQDLWAELDARRGHAAARDAGAPRAAPHWRDTFQAFGGFPTHRLGLDTPVRAVGPDGAARHAALVAQPLWSRWIVPQATVERVFAALARGPQTVGALARAVQADATDMVHIAAILAKMQLVELGPAQSSTIAESSRP
jgi:glycosyltransferase involved in cell wall biosynthesis